MGVSCFWEVLGGGFFLVSMQVWIGVLPWSSSLLVWGSRGHGSGEVL